jgi:WD40 repeat protein
MLRRWALSLLLGVVIFAVIAWSLGVWPLDSSNAVLGDSDQAGSDPSDQANLGELLYRAELIDPEPTAAAGAQQLAAIVIPACHLAPEHLQVLSSQREGQLLVVGAEVTPAEFARLPKNKRAAIFVQEKNQTTQRFYRRLLKGDVVKQSPDLGASTVGLLGSMMGQGSLAAAVALFPGRTQSPMVALVDPVLAFQDLAIKEAKFIAAEKDALAAEKILEELQEQHRVNDKLLKKGAVPEEQWRISKVQAEKARYDLDNKREAVKVSQSELNQSATMLDLHTIRNKYDGVWFIDRVLHNPGETLQGQHSMEVVLISRLDQLKAEGQLDVQYRKQLEDNHNEVLVEPSQEASPQWILTGHRGEIKALAVSKEDLIVSASDDGTAQVWNLGKNAPWVLAHPTAVQAVACSPRSAKDQEHSWCVSGCSDGTIRKWDLSQWGKTDVKVQPLAEKHSEGVSCLAFSPDGEWFASGGEDNAIFLWETRTGKLKYKFDERWGHRGSITALHFTGQAKLISAGKDNTVRVWTLCQQGARLDGREAITGREGKVSQLGVSQDGQALLLDRGNTLQVLRVQDRLPLGVLQNTFGITPFETVALFAPGFIEDHQKPKGKDRLGGKRRLILTAGASEGRLQLWVAPTPSQRGYEFVQLVPPATDRSPVTCAAFSAQVEAWLADKGERSFAVSGTKNGQVFVWKMPSGAEILDYQLPAKLELVGTSVEANTRQLPIIVHLDNPMVRIEDGIPQYRLMTGRTATVVVQPRTP